MSQQIRVLQCIECNLFQVDIVKKSNNKWECKVCRQKQSLCKEVFRGNGAECRLKVQELNMQHGEKHDERSILKAQIQQECYNTESISIAQGTERLSKWAAFVDEPIERTLAGRVHPCKVGPDSASEEPNIATKKTGKSVKRKSDHVVQLNNKRPNSKWQKFL